VSSNTGIGAAQYYSAMLQPDVGLRVASEKLDLPGIWLNLLRNIMEIKSYIPF
jgi:hypothetical protein